MYKWLQMWESTWHTHIHPSQVYRAALSMSKLRLETLQTWTRWKCSVTEVNICWIWWNRKRTLFASGCASIKNIEMLMSELCVSFSLVRCTTLIELVRYSTLDQMIGDWRMSHGYLGTLNLNALRTAKHTCHTCMHISLAPTERRIQMNVYDFLHLTLHKLKLKLKFNVFFLLH